MQDSSVHSFNQQDFYFSIKIKNGINEVELRPEGWDNLFLEEDIFDWWMKGSIEIKTPHESFERGSEELTLLGIDEKKAIYKFRNDGRDMIVISILPKDDVPGMSVGNFEDKKWRIELEAIIYDVEDYKHTKMVNKVKKLYFHEKTYQLMSEKNVEFTTANSGKNKGRTDIHKLNDDDRSLPTGEAIAELMKSDPDFIAHTELTDDPTKWNKGDPQNKILYTSGTNTRFIDDLNYIYDRHTAEEAADFQPCILKLERVETGKPKQFSLMSLQQYFEKAGKDTPGEYQIEHIMLDDHSQTGAANEVPIKKAPLSDSNNMEGEVKAMDYTNTSNYQLHDLSGLDYSRNLGNKIVVSHNAKKGQFNLDVIDHTAEKYKEFYKKSVVPNILTLQEDDRLPLTNYIRDGYNTEHIYSVLKTDKQRLVEGRNKIIRHYLFTNLGISLVLRGLTHRTPGRFFGLSRINQNIQEHDNKVEGQYIITNVVHHFTTQGRSYLTEMMGVKVHTYQEKTVLEDQ